MKKGMGQAIVIAGLMIVAIIVMIAAKACS